MVFERLVAEVTRVRPEALDLLAQKVWEGLARGEMSEIEAERLSQAIEDQRSLFRLKAAERASTAALKPVKPQRSPDRAKSIERRRRVAASGRLPPALACRFTLAEQAVLSIVASEVKRCGRCEWPIDKIAALAGCSRTTVQNALREASRLMLLNVSERRFRGRPSGYNIIKIVDAAWSAWLRLGGRGVGFRKLNSTDTSLQIRSKKRHWTGFDQGGNLLDLSQSATGKPIRA